MAGLSPEKFAIARRLARKGALWLALVAFTRKPRREG
jgi:hypothetical protein